MNRELLVLVIIAVFATVGITFFDIGITGTAVLEPKKICSTHADCTNPEVCCFFHGQKASVCHNPEACAEIAALIPEPAKEFKQDYPMHFILGSGILPVLGFLTYYHETR